MKGKIFTPEEANQMLPLVRRIADDIVRTYGEVTLALEAFENAKARAANQPGLETELRTSDAAVAAALDGFQTLIEEIESLGGTVKDYQSGLIDFYSEVDGEIVYLCWKPGEAAVSYWHRLDEGFSQRQPLPASVSAA
jgi:hypothetical protein